MRVAVHQFGILVEATGDTRIVKVRGDVDLETAQRFAEGLRAAAARGRGGVVIDLCEVPFMDSTGLHLLLNLMRRLARQGRRMTVACRPTGVRRLFELTRLNEMFEIYDSRSEAVAALERGPRLGV